MRTVFLGTSAFAAAVLRRLADSPHRPGLVVTRPDAQRGRGRRLAPPPVADAARELGLELNQPESVNDESARARIEAAQPEAVCVCAFGALIHEPLLSAYPMVNVHPSLLPRWRGAAPVERAIMAGDPETGVSIMQLVAELDAGPVALQGAEPIATDDTYGSLAPRLERLGGDLLVEALDGWPLELTPQPEDGVTYAEKIGPGDRTLAADRPAAELERTVRALHPHIGARLELPGGELLRVHEASVAEAAASEPPGGLAGGSGPVLEGALVERDGRLLYGTADGALDLRTVQPPGGKAMGADAFLRGHDVAPG